MRRSWDDGKRVPQLHMYIFRFGIGHDYIGGQAYAVMKPYHDPEAMAPRGLSGKTSPGEAGSHSRSGRSDMMRIQGFCGEITPCLVKMLPPTPHPFTQRVPDERRDDLPSLKQRKRREKGQY